MAARRVDDGRLEAIIRDRAEEQKRRLNSDERDDRRDPAGRISRRRGGGCGRISGFTAAVTMGSISWMEAHPGVFNCLTTVE